MTNAIHTVTVNGVELTRKASGTRDLALAYHYLRHDVHADAWGAVQVAREQGWAFELLDGGRH